MLIIKNKKGFSLIELLVAISFISVIIVLLFSIAAFNGKLRKLNEERTQALSYATQAMEAIKLIDWDDLDAGTYHPEMQSNEWVLVAGDELINNKFTRSLIIEDAYRASSSNGTSYGPLGESGYLDPDTKKVSVSISWLSKVGSNKEENLETYLYRWKANRWSQTDWIGGSGQDNWADTTRFYDKDSGVDVNISGVATLLSGFLNWNQATTSGMFNTPGNYDDNDVYELNGFAYLVTENNSYGSEFYILDVSDIYNPTQLSSINIGGGVTSVIVEGDYAYISTRRNDAELMVVNVSNPYSPFVTFSYSLPGNYDAEDIVVNDNELYIIQNNDLYSFSIVDPASPQFLDTIVIEDDARAISLLENTLYIATEENNGELQIVNVTNPANLQVIGDYDLPGSLTATDVVARGTRVYISTQNNSSGPEFFILDISDPLNPIYIGSYEVGEMVYSISIVGPYALLGTNFLDEELIVIDVSFPATINKVSGFDLNGYILGMSANCSVIYAATSSNYNEFFIVFTGVVDCGYASFGTLESSTFDSGSDRVTYNWVAWTGSEPINTDIRFQIATSGNIAGPWNFLGPDGTSGSYYTNGAKEFINHDAHLDQRYLRYKLFLNSDADWQVPILEEVTVSYSTYP